ncbi:putative ribosomal RNA-processing protein 17 [Rhexocercosporidium sp. MPI-PUGE-AT-0058]|nr:putative ribosomal RNA-processing protein 17 [Rhexocercosporidium sp. MPI-PUGE-AT-0058]
MDPSLLEPGIFLQPRPKKNVLSAQPNKRRKTEHKIEEISFDNDARADYLTGFHKRKVQRAKRAQEEAVKKGREERVVMRKQLREERKQELEQHVDAINAALRAAGDPDVPDSSSDSEAWGGISDDETSKSKTTPVTDHEEQYVSEDEDKYTTVTIEAVDVTKEGLHRVADEDSEDENRKGKGKKEYVTKEADGGKKKWPKKERKPKFRYESKVERKASRMKQKSKNKASADARKGSG